MPVAHESTSLGRRLARRRREIGASRETVARRAGIDAHYLDYLESDPGATPSRSVVLHLADALGTTVGRLMGGGGPRGDPQLVTLSRVECDHLLSTGGVGRFVFLESRGPVAVPVNFATLDGDIVFRTAPATGAAARAGQQRVSFEVDDLDEGFHEGWSVLVSGTARLVGDASDVARLERLGTAAWAGGDRPVWVRLTPTEVSGRRIIHPGPPDRGGRQRRAPTAE